MTKRAVGLLCSVLCSLPIAANAGSGFYKQIPANLASLAPGAVIDTQKETNFLINFNKLKYAKRILYRSTGQLGNPITASGMVFVPKGDAPEGGWPIVVWGHGTSGVGDKCSPSKNPDLYDNGTWLVYLKQVNKLVKEGYVVVAPDYEGMGTPGLHTYLLSDALGKVSIDGVRATKLLVPETSNKWAAIGHSEGGQASIAAGELADSYGLGLDYRGAVAYAPANNNLAQLMYVIENPEAIDSSSAPYLAYEAVGMRSINPSFNYANFLGPLFLTRMNDAEKHCWTEWFTVDNANIEPTFENTLNPNWSSDPTVQAYFTAIDNVGKRPAAGPVLILQGEADGLIGVLPILQADMCSQHTKVHAITYSNTGHDEVVDAAWPDARKWLARRFDDKSVKNDCE